MKKKRKIYNEIHREERNRKGKERGNQQCYDPKENEYCTLYALNARKKRNKEKYKDIIPKDCVVKEVEE